MLQINDAKEPGESDRVAPDFITFTGVDEKTDVAALKEISDQYPVEFGILVSTERHDSPDHPRYPCFQFIGDMIGMPRSLAEDDERCSVRHINPHGLLFAAHLCGFAARQVVDKGWSFWQAYAARFSRIQVNTGPVTKGQLLRAASFGADVRRPIILQARECFPNADTVEGMAVQWLYDKSGGRGIEPDRWIGNCDGPSLIGFAGGIGPHNVDEIVSRITETIGSDQTYWIDMESGIRTNDRFDVDKVRKVCETVWGASFSKSEKTWS